MLGMVTVTSIESEVPFKALRRGSAGMIRRELQVVQYSAVARSSDDVPPVFWKKLSAQEVTTCQHAWQQEHGRKPSQGQSRKQATQSFQKSFTKECT